MSTNPDVVLLNGSQVEQVWRNADLDAIKAQHPAVASRIVAAPAGTCAGMVQQADGTFAAPALSAAAVAAAVSRAVQAHIDATARSRQYDNGLSLASYDSSTNAAWKAEAIAFIAWRDSVWASVTSASPAPQTSAQLAQAISSLIANLPPITWPS